ncbi:MAG TPA: ABC-type transport auxiliary lipoprotein family protein [Candidatus Binatia bacterium]|jgi:cholesterol transport system auxiliary component
MKQKRLKLSRELLLLLLFISGCVNLQRSYPDRHYFALEAAAVEKPANPGGSGILEVSNLSISRRYEGQNFVYRTSDTGYETDFYNNFLILPAAMITEEVRKSLEQSRLFAYVIGPSSDLPANYVLEGSVNALYGDFSSSGPKAVIEIQFFLTQSASADNQVLLAKTYSQSAPVASKTPEALVKGWDQALNAIIASLITDIDATRATNERSKRSNSSPEGTQEGSNRSSSSTADAPFNR